MRLCGVNNAFQNQKKTKTVFKGCGAKYIYTAGDREDLELVLEHVDFKLQKPRWRTHFREEKKRGCMGIPRRCIHEKNACP